MSARLRGEVHAVSIGGELRRLACNSCACTPWILLFNYTHRTFSGIKCWRFSRKQAANCRRSMTCKVRLRRCLAGRCELVSHLQKRHCLHFRACARVRWQRRPLRCGAGRCAPRDMEHQHGVERSWTQAPSPWRVVLLAHAAKIQPRGCQEPTARL